MANLSPKGALTLDDMLHLARRAGFGLTPEQAQAFLTAHAAAPVDDWVDGTGIDRSAFTSMLATADPVKEDDSDTGPHPYRIGGAEAWRNDLERAQAYLAFRMQYDPYPFPERMALFFHNLFATGQHKVDNVALMVNQWDMLRASSLGKFDDLLVAVSKDPAMTIWLDSIRNNARGTSIPNENYAREVMELYSLGVDNGYNQSDITELAGALAGWSFTVDPADVAAEPANGDNRRAAKGTFAIYDGSPAPAGHLRWNLDTFSGANLPNMRRSAGTAPMVSFLGGSFQAEVPPTGMVKGEECIRAIVGRRGSNSATFLATRLIRHFVTTEFTAGDVADLAARIQLAGFDLRTVMKELLNSVYFYDAANRLSLVEGPVSWAVRAARTLGWDLAALATPGRAPAWALATPSFEVLGMLLLDPNGPNGWKEGVAWLNSNSVRYRTRLAAAASLAETTDTGGVTYTLFPNDPAAWFPAGAPTTPADILARLTTLMQPGYVPSAVSQGWLTALWPNSTLNATPWNDVDKRGARQVAFLILCSPGSQLY